jgi:hypothetical protein
MTSKRQSQIYSEGLRRGLLWLKNSTFDEMTCSDSMLRFEMALGLYGYVLEKPEWMKKEKFNKFITKDEFNNQIYSKILKTLYVELSIHNSESQLQNK